MRRLVGSLMLAALVGLLAGCETTPIAPSNTVGAPPKTSNKLAELHTKLGIGYMREGKLDLAWDRLRKALEEDPGYSTAHNAMALLELRLKNPEKAEEHFKRAVELDPTNSAAQVNYGSFLCERGRYKEGEQRLLQALKNSLYDRPEVAYTDAGLCMKGAGKLDQAEGYFRSALQRNPRIPVALLAMSEINLATKHFLPARAYLQRYLDISRHTPHALWLGVRIERALGDRDAAASYALELKGTYPDSHETKLLLKSEAQ